MIGENSSDAEVLEYGTAEQIKARFEAYLLDAPEREKEQAAEARRVELIEEQAYLAGELIEQLVRTIQTNTNARVIKKAVEGALSDSSYER